MMWLTVGMLIAAIIGGLGAWGGPVLQVLAEYVLDGLTMASSPTTLPPP